MVTVGQRATDESAAYRRHEEREDDRYDGPAEILPGGLAGRRRPLCSPLRNYVRDEEAERPSGNEPEDRREHRVVTIAIEDG